MSREDLKIAKKSREIGKQLTSNSTTSQDVLVQILDKVGNVGDDGYFTIQVGKKNIKARQLG